MKFPQFIKVPKYKRFNITPRYYDPIKEDIQIRTAKIENELKQDKSANYSSNIRGSFGRKVTRDFKAGYLRLIIFFVIIVSFGGYLYFGVEIFKFFFLLIPLYAYYRLRGGMKKK
jgi:hypothetical protein